LTSRTLVTSKANLCGLGLGIWTLID